MGIFTKYQRISPPTKGAQLRIDLNKKRITCTIQTFRFKDADTKQYVSYIPSLELSGYGETREEADDMMKFNLDEFFSYLFKISPEKAQQELKGLGWTQGLFKKQYSNAYIDKDGILQNINAENNLVESEILTAA